MTKDASANFKKARKLFPHAGNIVYFNSASDGPFCTPVHEAISANIDQRLAVVRENPASTVVADKLRGDYAKLIGAPKRTVGLGMNTSFALNLAAYGLPLKRGDEVLLSDVEFPALPYVWRAAAEARGLKLKYLKSKNLFFDIDELQKRIGKRTKVLALSYVQFFNGFKNDLKTISAICKKHGMYLVIDGIQGMGVEPINVRKLGIDVFTSGCHKWLLAPRGCSFFYVSDEVRDRIVPPFMTWLGADWHENYSDLFYYDRPLFDSSRRFEMGFTSTLNLLGMEASVKLFQDLGIANIQRHNHALLDRLAEYIRNSSKYRITSSMTPKHRSSILTFTTTEESKNAVAKLHRRILDDKIILVNREGSIRVAVHLFTNETDIDRLVTVLEG